MTLGIVKRTEEEFAEWLATDSGFLEGLASYDDEPIVLEQYQREFLANRARFRWVTKSRQVGFSFLFALEALARCHLRDKHTAVFVSYNLDDAKEKILIARQVHEELPLAYQKKLVVDSKTELAFESSGVNKRLSRILSHPSKAPRGKKGDVYLDELAHYVNDREVYRGSTALILRSNGQLTGCSTPLGRRGIFWEIATEELRKYAHHTRQTVPWWLCRFFCLDVKRASEIALDLPTEERVEKFGSQTLIEQFDSLPLEDFQQEFECVLPGSLVLTERGPTPIEDVAVGEKVLTHRGRYRSVVATRRTPFRGALKEIRTYHSSEPLYVTGNHPVLAVRVDPCLYEPNVRCRPVCTSRCSWKPIALPEPNFVPVRELRPSDILVLPVRGPDGMEAPPTELRISDWFTYPPAYKSRNRLPEAVPLSNELLTLVGYYLAEGSCSKSFRRVEFSLHRKEAEYAAEIRRAVRRLLGLKTDTRVQGRGMILGVNSVVLGNVFAKMFGRVQHERRLPPEWLNLPTEKLWHLVRAFMNGDGCRHETAFVTTICARTFAYQLRDILVRVGLVPSIRHLTPHPVTINGRRSVTAEHYEVRVHRKRTESNRGRRGWNDGRYVYLPIRSVGDMPYDGGVYNLQVAEDESYVVGSHAVHNCSFVDESYSFFPYELILPCTEDGLALADEPSGLARAKGRLVAGFDVGRMRDRSELAVFEQIDDRFTCRMLRSFDGVPFAEQEATLRHLMSSVSIARMSIDRSGIGMNLAENLSRDFPQVVGENFTNESKERWATDFKILLQRRDVILPRDREMVGQIHSIKRRVLPSGKVSFDAERNARGHADKFWAVALACQKERSTERRGPAGIGVRVLG
jgi:phage FluMu gp28-like protein/intein/homing endonuclease